MSASVPTVEGTRPLFHDLSAGMKLFWYELKTKELCYNLTFPSKRVEKLMLATTDKGDTVFDPFLGSSTMLELSHKNGRNFIGCDINEDFVTNGKNIYKEIK